MRPPLRDHRRARYVVRLCAGTLRSQTSLSPSAQVPRLLSQCENLTQMRLLPSTSSGQSDNCEQPTPSGTRRRSENMARLRHLSGQSRAQMPEEGERRSKRRRALLCSWRPPSFRIDIRRMSRARHPFSTRSIGQPARHHRPLPFRRLQPHAAAVQLDDLVAQCQAET